MAIGMTRVSFFWLALPSLLVAVTTEALYRNSTDRPAKLKGNESGLFLASRIWPGILISGASYFIGHFFGNVAHL